MSTRSDFVDAVVQALVDNVRLDPTRVFKGSPEPARQSGYPFAIVKAFQPHEHERITMGTSGTVIVRWRCKVWILLGPDSMTAQQAEKAQYDYADKMRLTVEGDLQGEAWNVYLEDATDNLDPDQPTYFREAGTAPQLAYSIMVEEQKTANAVAS